MKRLEEAISKCNNLKDDIGRSFGGMDFEDKLKLLADFLEDDLNSVIDAMEEASEHIEELEEKVENLEGYSENLKARVEELEAS